MFILLMLRCRVIWSFIWQSSELQNVHTSDAPMPCNLVFHLAKFRATKCSYYSHSGKKKFVNPLEFSVFLHKFDVKCDQIFMQVLITDKKNLIK